MSGNNEFEKLQLTKQDLSHIYGKILKTTTAKLDLHLPTSDKDPLKRKVADLLDDFILKSFDMAKDSMIIDGRDMSSRGTGVPISEILSVQSREKIEPFDFELNGQLRKLLEKVEEETIRVTSLRRELPLRARDLYNSLVSETDNEVTAYLNDLEAHNGNPQEDLDTTPDIDVSIPSLESIKGEFAEAVLELSSLKKTLPQQKAILDELDETIKFLETAYEKQIKVPT